MPNFFRSKGFILIIVTLLLLVIVGISGNPYNSVNGLGNLISVPLAPVQMVIAKIETALQSISSYFRNVSRVNEENERLKAEIEVLRKDSAELEGYKERVQELRETLNLKNQLGEFDPIGANVISSDAGNWFNTFRIDRGTRDGIFYNQPIISSKGLVGRVTQADITSSKGEAIIDPNSVLYGRIIRTRDLVRVKGELNLKDKGLCKMDYIPADVDILVGDYIETSGMGGIYPKGILVGKVIEVRKSGDELNKYAIIEPAVDFKRLEDIIVLKTRSSDEAVGGMGK